MSLKVPCIWTELFACSNTSISAEDETLPVGFFLMTHIVVFIDELALQPGNAVVTPVKSAQRYVAMKECRRNMAGVSPRFQKSAFVVHSGGKGDPAGIGV